MVAFVTYIGNVQYDLICKKHYLRMLPYKAIELLIFIFYRTCVDNTHVCYAVLD